MSSPTMRIEDRGYEWVCAVHPGWNALTISVLMRFVFVWGIIITLLALHLLGRDEPTPVAR